MHDCTTMQPSGSATTSNPHLTGQMLNLGIQAGNTHNGPEGKKVQTDTALLVRIEE